MAKRREDRKQRSRLGRIFFANRLVGSDTEDAVTQAANVSRGRAAGRALHSFNDSEGWVPPRGTRDADEAFSLRYDKKRDALLHRVQGINGAIRIDSTAEFPVGDLKQVVGAVAADSSRGQIEVAYVARDGRTYSELFHKEDGKYVPTWPPGEDGGRQRRQIHRRELTGMSSLFEEGYAGIDDEGDLVFGGFGSSRVGEVKDAFRRDLAYRGRVVSVASHDEGLIVLQETSSGEKTLSTIRVWETSRDQDSIKWRTEVRSVPVDPTVSEVTHANTYGDYALGDSTIGLIRGKDLVSKVSFNDIDSQASRYKHVPLPVEAAAPSPTVSSGSTRRL